MSDPQANAQLELCCRVGSIDGLLEALEDGADIDCHRGSPLFIAIMARDRAVVSALVENGAETSIFGIGEADHEEIVEALIALAPPAANESESTGDETDPVDAKLVRAFDKLIRGKGLGEPVRQGRAEAYPAFRKGLQWIAAEECEACVAEFLDLVKDGLGDDAGGEMPAVLEESASRIAELSDRYRAAPEVPVDLLKDYLKEKRK